MTISIEYAETWLFIFIDMAKKQRKTTFSVRLTEIINSITHHTYSDIYAYAIRLSKPKSNYYYQMSQEFHVSGKCASKNFHLFTVASTLCAWYWRNSTLVFLFLCVSWHNNKSSIPNITVLHFSYASALCIFVHKNEKEMIISSSNNNRVSD